MTTKHTPGPWTIYDDGEDGSDIIMAHIDGENSDIAEMSRDLPPAQRKANAALIASAPDLLAERDRLREVNAELVAALEDVTSAYERAITALGAHEWGMLTIEAARAALAKVRA